ncbi:Fis family transcriptional regulator [Actinomyces trachealis]|uniref:Fis family transcriptional regulator n=1 Tax=Actinomyces trachealis TaxID=2763540 RepID=UPI001892D192|nr:Fis family transcriptional regulator [Actinomyces trachealis]
MDLDSLFADLENAFEAERRADLLAASHELAEAELGEVGLADRLCGAAGQRLQLAVRGGVVLAGVLLAVRGQHVLLREDSGTQALVPLRSVIAAWPLGLKAVSPEGGVHERSLRSLMRALVRRGVVVRLSLLGVELAGRPVRVGADHVDVVVAGGAAMGGGVNGRVSVALDAVDVLRLH